MWSQFHVVACCGIPSLRWGWWYGEYRGWGVFVWGIYLYSKLTVVRRIMRIMDGSFFCHHMFGFQMVRGPFKRDSFALPVILLSFTLHGMHFCFWSLYDLDELETCEQFSVTETRRMMHCRRASYFLTGRVEWVQESCHLLGGLVP